MARSQSGDEAVEVAEPLIERSEVAALPFNVSDIAVIVDLLKEDDDGEEEAHEG